MGFLKLILVFLALAYVGWHLRQLLLGQSSQQWKSVKGKVLRAWTDEHVFHGNDGDSYTYTANVVYSYSVGSGHFESTNLTFAPTTRLSEEAVTELLDGISEGVELDVFYDPKDYERAVLIPGSSGGNNLMLVWSIAVLAFIVWLCFFSKISGPH
jgi:hypothetical protein